jgi:hypothetical protein
MRSALFRPHWDLDVGEEILAAEGNSQSIGEAVIAIFIQQSS